MNQRPIRSLLLSVLAGMACGYSAAQESLATANLPPTESAVRSIEAEPGVVLAHRALNAASLAGAAVAAGTHEWVGRASTQRRTVSAQGASTEWSATLERAVRIGGKAGIDKQLGEVETQIARARLGESRHEAARALADRWIEALAASKVNALLGEQLESAEATLATVQKRQRAGEASVLDVNAASLVLDEARRQLSQATTQLATSQARLRSRFPSSGLPGAQWAAPVEPPWSLELWRERVIGEADSIKVAEGQVRKAELIASRLRADRTPDPTIGIFAASEAFGKERVIGVSLTVPLAGEHRDLRLRQALEEVEIARATLDQARRDVALECAEAYANAAGGLDRWRIADRAASTAREVARLTRRAYSLGEGDLQAVLIAHRQALDALRSEAEAHADALRWGHRLLVDAHAIWDLAHD